MKEKEIGFYALKMRELLYFVQPTFCSTGGVNRWERRRGLTLVLRFS
jgi:hypothetical protein